MTMATSAPVMVPRMATPNRMSNQLTTGRPSDVTNAESPCPSTVEIPQWTESKTT